MFSWKKVSMSHTLHHHRAFSDKRFLLVLLRKVHTPSTGLISKVIYPVSGISSERVSGAEALQDIGLQTPKTASIFKTSSGFSRVHPRYPIGPFSLWYYAGRLNEQLIFVPLYSSLISPQFYYFYSSGPYSCSLLQEWMYPD